MEEYKYQRALDNLILKIWDKMCPDCDDFAYFEELTKDETKALQQMVGENIFLKNLLKKIFRTDGECDWQLTFGNSYIDGRLELSTEEIDFLKDLIGLRWKNEKES